MKIRLLPWPAIGLAVLFGLWGLSWGLPSKERAALFLKPENQTPAFYQTLEKHRNETYERMGLNPIAHYGRQSRAGKTYEDKPDPLAVYSGFLVRTHHGDEQQALVMLSRLNPFQGKWYPYTFQYGGAYIYPLAVYLKTLQVSGLIRLVPQASFYYAHPDEIGKVYYVVRIASVIALLFATIPLFLLARRLLNERAAHWAACLFVLLPACIGNAKLAKPHMWAGAWTLWMIYAAFRVSEEKSWKPLLLAAGCYGLAVGTTVSQSVFLPFLIWGCWRNDKKETLLNLTVAGILSLSVFLITNFYIFVHFQDFKDELYLFRHYYPWGVTVQSLADFFFKASPWAAGILSWGLMGGGMLYAVSKKRDTVWGVLAMITLGISLLLAFQNQSQLGSAMISRLFLALLGLKCLFASWLVFDVLRWPWLAWVSLLVALLLGSVYDRHYASDRVPYDNASLASAWVTKNVPPGSVILQDQALPQTFGFPPIDFATYRISQIGTPEFETLRGPAYAILPPWATKARETLLQKGYTPVQRFAQSPLQKIGLTDDFTTANFPLDIYARN